VVSIVIPAELNPKVLWRATKTLKRPNSDEAVNERARLFNLYLGRGVMQWCPR